MRMSEEQIGPLDVLVSHGSVDGPVAIICHGYGADAYDLASLSDVLNAPAGTTWIFPQGPIEVPLGPHMSGRAWFDIDVQALERAMREGTTRDLTHFVPANLKIARQYMLELISTLKRPLHKILIGGFSQGAMLSVDVSLQLESNLAGLVLFSGALFNSTELQTRVNTKSGLKFFQSHGKQDSVLSFAGAQSLEKFLLSGGLKGQLLPFQGGHEIPHNVIEQASGFVRKRLTAELN
jgi:phospholipase/carboxylesterase